MNFKKIFQAQNKIVDINSYISRYITNEDNVMMVT